MSDTLSLVYIINSLTVGGAEIGMCRILDGIDASDYDVTVVALTGKGDELMSRIPPSVRVIEISPKLNPSLSALYSFLRVIRSTDIIIGSLYHSVLVARIAGLLNKSSTVATWQHNTEFETNSRQIFFQFTSNMSDVVLADSKPVSEMLINRLGIDETVIHTVPIAGIQLDEYTRATHDTTRDIRVGSIGRIVEQKNYTMLLDVAEQFLGSDVSFYIAGDGDLREEIQENIQRRNLTNVSLLGYVDDVPKFLSTLDIYIQPSLWEGLCMTVLEAMAAELPVVGSDVGGISRNVKDGISGYVYDPSDINGYVAGIKKLSNKPQKRKDFGKQGRRIVEESFTQSVLVNSFENAVRDK